MMMECNLVLVCNKKSHGNKIREVKEKFLINRMEGKAERMANNYIYGG